MRRETRCLNKYTEVLLNDARCRFAEMFFKNNCCSRVTVFTLRLKVAGFCSLPSQYCTLVTAGPAVLYTTTLSLNFFKLTYEAYIKEHPVVSQHFARVHCLVQMNKLPLDVWSPALLCKNNSRCLILRLFAFSVSYKWPCTSGCFRSFLFLFRSFKYNDM